MIIIVMGVTGCGKSTIGKLLADRLNLPFHDADDYHPKENVRKMRDGIPLTDQDRQPWLEELSELITIWDKEKGAVLACSALKEDYRRTLQTKVPARWVFLEGTPDVIKDRCTKRAGHFMSHKLIQSQFAILEKPDYGIHLNISSSPEELVEKIIKNL